MQRASSTGLLLLSGIAAVVACEDGSSSANNPSVQQPDFDAGSQEGGTTNPPPGTGLVVTVVAAGKPTANVRVLFHDAAGAVIADTKTDANGKVTAATAPSQMTLAIAPIGLPDQQRFTLVTYAGIEAGDSLTFDLSMSTDPLPSLGYEVTLGATVPNTEVYHSIANGSCDVLQGTDELTKILPISSRCVRPNNSLLVIARDTAGLALAFGWQKKIPAPAGPQDPISIGSFAEPTNVGITTTNVPPGTDVAIVGAAIADGVGYQIYDDDPTTLEMPPSGFADAIQVSVAAREQNGPRSLGFTRRGAHDAAAFDFATALPRFSTVTTTIPTPHRPEIAWTTERSLTGADAVDGQFFLLRWGVQENPDLIIQRAWYFAVPPGATSFKAPELPADLRADYAPPADFVAEDFYDEGTAAASLVESTLLPGYKELKALPFGGWSFDLFLDPTMPLPAAGVLRVSAIHAALAAD